MASHPDTGLTELTLDPENWDELRTLGHRMLDDMLDHLSTLREQPAWQPLPEAAAARLRQPVPREPAQAEAVYEEFLTDVLPYTSGNRHPRSWGWVRGNGTPLAMLAEMLAAGINAHMAGGQQAPAVVEEQVLAWLAELMGMPRGATGLLTSGGTMANLLGVAVGRNTRAGYDLRREGLQGEHPRLILYGSAETHSWSQKAVELLGIGTENYRRIPVNGDSQIETGRLRAQIEDDLAAGHRPIAVIGNCGTVNTGAVDDMHALAALCREYGLWFHVDGAFGALLKLTDGYSSLASGIELADSLAFDLHKWGYLPFEIGCVLFRDPAAATAAFATHVSYLEAGPRGMLAGGLPFADRGIEHSRNFKALKAWMLLKTHGVDAIGALIEQNVEQARHLASLVRTNRELELLAPCTMNIVCFRYRPQESGWSEEALNGLNRELVLRLQESGQFIVSGTTLAGSYAIRVANTNHRSRMEDFDALAAEAVRVGRGLAAEKLQGRG